VLRCNSALRSARSIPVDRDACGCDGAGMPCPICNSNDGLVEPKMPLALRTIKPALVRDRNKEASNEIFVACPSHYRRACDGLLI
jgi:hypothetical protein